MAEEVDGGHDVTPELLFGREANMAQHRAGQLGAEAFDEVEPRGMCLGAKVNIKRPAGCSASPALVSLEICAE
jgi:hypothetical protein